MRKEKVWVWFKGGLQGGEWKGGFIASSCEEEGLIIESPNYVNCKLPEWRVSLTEPEDKKLAPEIPTDGKWKIF